MDDDDVVVVVAGIVPAGIFDCEVLVLTLIF